MKNRKERLLRPLRGLAITSIAIMSIALAVTGCGRKEPPKVDPVTSQGSDNQNDAGKGKSDGVEHKVLSFNLEGMTEKGERSGR